MNRTLINRILFTVAFLSLSSVSFAQEKSFMRDNGMIYVVVAVMVTILIGLILYMVRVDRKLTRIEKETEHRS